MKKILILFLMLLFVSPIFSALDLACMQCRKDPYAVNCASVCGSLSDPVQAPVVEITTPDPPATYGGYNFLEIVWTIAGIIAILYFGKKLFFERR